MQFYAQSPNFQDTRKQQSDTFPQTDELNAFLLAQATQFISQNSSNPKVIQTTPQLPVYQRQHTHHNLNIQPYYSDEALIIPNVGYNQVILKNTDNDVDFDLYLTEQAEKLVQQSLGAEVNVLTGQNNPQTIQFNTPHKIYHETQNYIMKPVQQGQNIQKMQQIPLVNPVQKDQKIQNIKQAPQIQQVIQKYYPHQAQVRVQPQIQIGQPYIVENGRRFDIPLPQLEQVVTPSPVQEQVVVQKKVVAPPVVQRQQVQVVNKSPEPAQQANMQFIQKGPKGEMLYKITEGGQNFYIKRGLTVEAVNNYSLAHLIGVGPPVEILGNDGVKMEEGVNLRHAVRDKIISMDEVKNQIQGLHKTLFDTGMAHCDVKFENCLYFPKYKKVLLIDNGDLAVYGNRRRIKTPGANSTLLIHGNEERNRVGPATDLRGFMHIMKNATEEDINMVQ